MRLSPREIEIIKLENTAYTEAWERGYKEGWHCGYSEGVAKYANELDEYEDPVLDEHFDAL